MNSTQLVASFRDYPIDYVTNNYRWCDAKVLSWLNEAEREACIRAKLLFDADTDDYCEVAVAAGTARYALHDLVVDVFRVFIFDADGTLTPLKPKDREELDRTDPSWRTTTGEPTGYVFDEGAGFIHLNRIPSADCTLRLEIYRLPSEDMVLASTGVEATSPEIAPKHHSELVNWACYKALSTEDFEELEGMQQRSLKYLALFERYFGKKPDANRNRRMRMNTPHTNKCHW